MLYYNINYYHNRLYRIKKDYYVYIEYISDPKYKFDIKIIDNNLLLEIIDNKNISKINVSIMIRIINFNKEKKFEYKIIKRKTLNIGNIDEIKYEESNYYNFIIDEFKNKFNNFDIDYYIRNNKLINNGDDIEFIKFHWFLTGRFNPYHYFKYLLKKNEELILGLDTNIINYDVNKKNTLLFIDDRYDHSFIYLLKLFNYSVDNSWNITIFTSEENRIHYEDDINKIGSEGKINIIEKFKSINDYNNLLKNYKFWNKIREENVLLFQYDSFCMGKFDEIFFKYNYIGARWPHNPLELNIFVGNGGTSFRKTRTMESISKMYKNNQAEDLFFSYYLNYENLNNCSASIADKFSFENIFNNESIYAHQIYNTIKLEDLDTFVNTKIKSFYK
jgi:hypothetical protein